MRKITVAAALIFLGFSTPGNSQDSNRVHAFSAFHTGWAEVLAMEESMLGDFTVIKFRDESGNENEAIATCPRPLVLIEDGKVAVRRIRIGPIDQPEKGARGNIALCDIPHR